MCSWLQTPGFLSTNVYLMAAHETRDSNISRDILPLPPPGPTLIDFYFPDHDRHVSGLNTFEIDHTRALYDDDADVKELQTKQDPLDHLTDSESDDDDAYTAPRPSIARVKQALAATPAPVVPMAINAPPPAAVAEVPAKGAPPAGKHNKGTAQAAAPEKVVESPIATKAKDEHMEDMQLDIEDRNNEQVELLRDRKILEMETYLLKLRQKDADDIAKK